MKARFRKGECRICGETNPACWVDVAHTLCGDCVDCQDDPTLEQEPECPSNA